MAIWLSASWQKTVVTPHMVAALRRNARKAQAHVNTTQILTCFPLPLPLHRLRMFAQQFLLKQSMLIFATRFHTSPLWDNTLSSVLRRHYEFATCLCPILSCLVVAQHIYWLLTPPLYVPLQYHSLFPAVGGLPLTLTSLYYWLYSSPLPAALIAWCQSPPLMICAGACHLRWLSYIPFRINTGKTSSLSMGK